MDIYDCFQAGYNKAESEKPPYPSSSCYMAYMAGIWCRSHNIAPLEIKPGRGYKMTINRTWSLDFKDDNNTPKVTRIN